MHVHHRGSSVAARVVAPHLSVGPSWGYVIRVRVCWAFSNPDGPRWWAGVGWWDTGNPPREWGARGGVPWLPGECGVSSCRLFGRDPTQRLALLEPLGLAEEEPGTGRPSGSRGWGRAFTVPSLGLFVSGGTRDGARPALNPTFNPAPSTLNSEPCTLNLEP